MSVSLPRILCSNCRKTLFHYRGSFATGAPIRSKDFYALPGVPDPKAGDPMNCPFCHAPWYMVNARSGSLIVLTDHGWKPQAPEGKAPLTILQSMNKRETVYVLSPEIPPEFKDGQSEFQDPAARWRQEAKEKEIREKEEPKK